MGIPVKLQVFEGPLDLLLHLIDKNKIDIYDIPIVEITNQYMDYIKAMEREDLNVMSEFLVMAATLLDIKCKMLLPKEVTEDGEEEDPRQELVEQRSDYPGGSHELCGAGRFGRTFRESDIGNTEPCFSGRDQASGRQDRSGKK